MPQRITPRQITSLVHCRKCGISFGSRVNTCPDCHGTLSAITEYDVLINGTTLHISSMAGDSGITIGVGAERLVLSASDLAFLQSVVGTLGADITEARPVI